MSWYTTFSCDTVYKYMYTVCQLFCTFTERSESKCDVTGEQIGSSTAANHRRRGVQREQVT